MTMKRPYVVVVGTDFSREACRALAAAYAQACREAPAELHVVYAALAVDTEEDRKVVPFAGLTTVPVPRLDELQTQLRTQLETVIGASVSTDHRVRIMAHVIVEVPSIALTQLASDLEADLLVIGTHGLNGVARWILGSIAEGVIRSATCPVLVVPPAPTQLPVPKIEPPCPSCVAARRASSGAELWCAQHRERHGRRHTYYQASRVGADTNLPLVVHET
jgi:nucleotide-binding universal stress UspA family protein